MKNTRRKNVVVYVMHKGEKYYFKKISLDGKLYWTKDVNNVRRESIGEARDTLALLWLRNRKAEIEVVE